MTASRRGAELLRADVSIFARQPLFDQSLGRGQAAFFRYDRECLAQESWIDRFGIALEIGVTRGLELGANRRVLRLERDESDQPLAQPLLVGRVVGMRAELRIEAEARKPRRVERRHQRAIGRLRFLADEAGTLHARKLPARVNARFAARVG